MSRLRADVVVNKNATGPFEASQGIKIPTNKSIVIGTSSGSEGQFLKKSSTGMTWGTIPDASVSQKGLVQIGSGLSIQSGILSTTFDGSVGDLSDVDLSTPPVIGQVLKWDGENWTASTDINFSGDYNDLFNLPTLTLEGITGNGNATANSILVGGLTLFDATDTDRNTIYDWVGDTYNQYVQTLTNQGKYNISIDDSVIVRIQKESTAGSPGVGINTTPAFTGLDIAGNLGFSNNIHINSNVRYVQSVIPNTTNNIDLGSTTNLWRSGYFLTSVLIGSGTTTGVTNQKLQVTGGAYVSGNFGVGVTDPQEKLEVQGNTQVNGNITLTGELRGPSTFVIDPIQVGDSTGVVQIKGDLQVDGTTTTINSTVTTIADPIIELRKGNSLLADDGGVQVNLTTNGSGVVTAYQRVQWNNANTRWETTDGTTAKPLVNTVDSFTVGGDFTFNGNVTLGNAVTDTVTVNSQFVNGTKFRTAQTATNTIALSAYDVDGASYTDLITLTASNTPTLTLTSTGVGTINNMNIGATTRGTGAFTTLAANNTTTINPANANVSITPSGTGVLTVSSGAVGTIDNMNIGATTRGTGAFTTLNANGNVTLGDASADTLTTNATSTFNADVTLNANLIIGNADTDVVTITSQFANGTQLKTTKAITETLNIAAYDVDGAAYVNLITLTASNTPTLTLTSTGVGTINNMSIGATTRSTGAFTTLDANNTVGLSPANATVTISPTGTGTLTVSPATTGTINNMNIGATTRGTGAFTTLDANGNVTLGDASTDTVTVNSTSTFNASVTLSGAATNLTVGGELRGPATFIIDPATVGDETGVVRIRGGLEVLGTTTTINSTVTTIADPLLELRRGNSLTAADGGVQVNLTTDGTGTVTSYQRLQWNNSATRWETTDGTTAKPLVNTVDGATFDNNVAFNANLTIGNAVTDTITVNSQFITGTQLRTSQSSTNTLSLSAYDVDGAAYVNLITLTASNTPTLTLTSTGVGTIDNMNIGATTRGTGAFTTLNANSTVGLSPANAAVTISPSGTGTVTINPATVGTIDSMNIGATTRGTGAFTTLNANSTVGLSPANAAVTISPSGTGTVTINPATVGAVDNVNIGATTRGTGAFTTLNANGNVTLGDAVTDTITVNSQFVTGTQLRTAQLDTNTLSLSAYDVDGVAYVNLITLTASNTPTLTLTSTGVGSINNMSIGATTRSTGAFTTLDANSTVGLSPANAAVTISPTGTGTVTISPATAGSINNMSIGATTRGTGAFTTLNANSTVGLSPANATVTISPTGTGTVTINPATAGSIDNVNIGATTRGTGAFTTLNANGNVTLGDASADTVTINGTTQVNAALTFTGATSHLTLTGELRGPATFIIDPATVGDNTGIVEVKGDLQVNGANTADRLKNTAAPATATSTGTAGEIRYASGFIYVCVATNTWQRAAIATW